MALQEAMKAAIIFTAENSTHEDSYEKLSNLLAFSIRHFHSDIDMYCGIFSDKRPTDDTIEELQRLDVNIVEDIKFRGSYYSDINKGYTTFEESCSLHPEKEHCCNYLTKLYCQYYFSNELLQQYDYLIYLDVDVVLLRSIDFEYMDKIKDSLILYDFPKEWMMEEQGNIAPDLDIDKEFYLNFVSTISPRNSNIYKAAWEKADFIKDRPNLDGLIKQADIIFNSDLDKVYNDKFGSFLPWLPLTKDTVFFHYDGFHWDQYDCGAGGCTLNKLREVNTELHDTFINYLAKIGVDISTANYGLETYSIESASIENEILKRLPEFAPYIVQNKPELNTWLKKSDYVKQWVRKQPLSILKLWLKI